MPAESLIDSPTQSRRPEAGRSADSGLGRLLVAPATAPFVVLVALYILFNIVSKVPFYSLAASSSWLNVASLLGVLAVPVGALLIAGEFDLSIGSVVGTSTMVVGLLTSSAKLPMAVAIVCALVASTAVGLLNGYIVTRTGLQSFIVTLATLLALEGLSLGVSTVVAGTTSISLYPTGAVRLLFGSSAHGFAVSIIWWLVIAGAGWFVLSATSYGNWIYAIGGGSEMARRAGVPVRGTKIVLFGMSAFSAGLVGVLLAVQYQSANVVTGQGYVFDVPVAAVIGGVLLSGGYGSVLGISCGVALYGIVSQGVFYTGWDSNWSQLILGLLLLAAVLSNNYVRDRAVALSRLTAGSRPTLGARR